jgi:hypothetical protein
MSEPATSRLRPDRGHKLGLITGLSAHHEISRGASTHPTPTFDLDRLDLPLADLVNAVAQSYISSYPHLDQVFPRLASVAAAAWRRDPSSQELATTTHRHLSVLWVSLDEFGAAWCAQAKARPPFLTRGNPAVEEDIASVAKLSAVRRLVDSREMARILTDLGKNRHTKVRIPMPAPQLIVSITFTNGVLQFKSTWSAFMRISDQQFHLLSILLGSPGVATEWRAQHAPVIELRVNNTTLTADCVYQPLDLFVRSQLGADAILPLQPITVKYGIDEHDISMSFRPR